MAGIVVAVVCFLAPLMPATADPLGSAKAQEASVAAQVQAGAAHIRTLTLAYEQADFQANALQQQVAQDKAQLHQIQARVTTSLNFLRFAAIISYTGGAGDTTFATAPAAGPLTSISDPSVRAEYLDIATGDITDAVDRYKLGERALAGAESTLATQKKAADEALASVGAAQQAAIQEAAVEQAQLASLQGHVVQLTEAAAVAAAQQRAAARATQGLPVNNGLVTLVRTIVASPAPSSARPAGGGAGGVWQQLRECESGNNYQENSGNGFYGAYQFSQQTWSGLGYPGRPDLEPPAIQNQAAIQLQAEAGWGQWPACAAALGLT